MNKIADNALTEVRHYKKDKLSLTTWEYTDSKTSRTYRFDDHKKALSYMSNRFEAWSIAIVERPFIWDEVKHFKIFRKPSKEQIEKKLKKKEYAMQDTGSTLKMAKKTFYKRRRKDVFSKKNNWW